MRLVTRYSLIILITLLLFFSAFCIKVLSYEKIKKTDIEELAFKQEIPIPIDTSLDKAKFQPIDTHIDFTHPCWAKNETIHSIRVCYEDNTGLNEIESQIYNLKHSDNIHISSCGLVFLIPESANGKEKYYVYYDSQETNPPYYTDHITIIDTHYFYEPISGQIIEFDYYEVKEEGYVIYAVIQKGELIGNPVAQSVIKMKPDSLFVETYNIEQLCGFDIRYGIVDTPGYYGTGYAERVKKNLLIDGNLMAIMRIECKTPKGDLKTDNIYTYYYCPTTTKKISVNVYHEVLKTIDIEKPSILDGTFSGIVSIKSRSATIEKMNAGKILPSLTVFSEDETIEKYLVPSNPDSEIEEVILSTSDDIDLGSKGWISLNEPKTGEAHGLIMDRNLGFGEGEEDGVQIKAYVKQDIKLPGLEAETGNVFLLKNNYEKGGSQKTILNQGYNVNFNIEFISVQNEGYEKIDFESEIFQTLIKKRPILRENITDVDEEEKRRYTITATVHFAPSFPLGSLLSAALGRNFPYIYAELYKDNSFKSSGSVSRLPLGKIELDLEGKNLFQKLKTVIGLFDWRNVSIFKKISFSDLEPGKYIVKIYRENLLFGRERKFIGFEIVELNKDKTIRIYCRPQATVKLSVLNQDKKRVENAKFQLISNDVIISETLSNVNENSIITAPSNLLKPYNLRLIYQGFLVDEIKIRLGYLNHFFPISKQFLIEQLNLNINFRDKWNFAPEIEVNPFLTSEEMIEPVVISAEIIGVGKYQFNNLFPAKYNLKAGYKSFEIKKEIEIKNKHTLDLTFPAEYTVNINIFNSYGEEISGGRIIISRKTKTESSQINEYGKVNFMVPPGDYELTIFSEDKLIAKQKILIRGTKNIDIVSTQQSLYHTIFIYIGIALAICSFIFMFLKKDVYFGIKIFVISLLIIALFSSWWGVSGEQNFTESNTKTLLIPSKIITLTSTSEISGGEISQVPEEVTMVLNLISMVLIITILIIFISIIISKKLPRGNTILSVLCIVFLIIMLVIFTYAMSQITEVSVGNFMGSGSIETTIPGLSETVILPSTWGPENGFYLSIIAVITLLMCFVYSKIKTKHSDKWIYFPRTVIKRWMISKK